MATPTSPLTNLIPEIYPIIAAHLPLSATPSSLLSLALTNHQISNIVQPLIYSRLILKSEEDALFVFQKLLDDTDETDDRIPLGKVVRELHVQSDLSDATQKGETSFDVITGLKKVIGEGRVPFLHTLGLTISSSWHYDKEFNPVDVKFGKLDQEFWSVVGKNCARFKGVILNGFRDADEDNEKWLDDSGTLTVPNVSSFSLQLMPFSISDEGCEKLIKHIETLAPTLHTLDLALNSANYTSVAPILALTLPLLRSLTLSSFDNVNTADAQAFWERHSELQYIDVADNVVDHPWFSNEIKDGFLPKLKHLRASFKDARILAPILPQLISLSIVGSVNAQVPYLLRSVLQKPLDNLQSLSIGQSPSNSGKDANVEGALWFEDSKGVHEGVATRQHARKIWDSYVPSLASAVPNVEEIGFHGYSLDINDFVKIKDELSAFTGLKRLYYEGANATYADLEAEYKDNLVEKAKEISTAVPTLESITDANILSLPYATVRFRNGEAELGKGYGMKIGHDDDAFPSLPCRSKV